MFTFELTVDAKALTEAKRMAQRWHYGPRDIAENAYVFLLLARLGDFSSISSVHEVAYSEQAFAESWRQYLIFIYTWRHKRHSRKTRDYLEYQSEPMVFQ